MFILSLEFAANYPPERGQLLALSPSFALTSLRSLHPRVITASGPEADNERRLALVTRATLKSRESARVPLQAVNNSPEKVRVFPLSGPIHQLKINFTPFLCVERAIPRIELPP